MKYVTDYTASVPARRELLNWIISNQQQQRQNQSVDRIKIEAEADIAGMSYGRLLEYDQLKAAFRLVYNAYLRRGLIKENPAQLRILPHHLLPTTEVLAASLRGDVVNTLSLVLDGELGLPLEKLYTEEVEMRRRNGRLLGEISCLADRRRQSRSTSPSTFRVLFRVMCLVIQTAAQRGVDELLITVHPRHSRFYQRRFAFVVAGDVRNYDLVEGNPAVLLSLDLKAMPHQEREIYERVFAQPLPKDLQQAVPIPCDVRESFREFLMDY